MGGAVQGGGNSAGVGDAHAYEGAEFYASQADQVHSRGSASPCVASVSVSVSAHSVAQLPRAQPALQIARRHSHACCRTWCARVCAWTILRVGVGVGVGGGGLVVAHRIEQEGDRM